MKFILITHGGIGCDYTIGCGVATMPIEAETREEAKLKAPALVFEYYGEDRVDSITIAEAPEEIDLKAEKDRMKEEKERVKKEKQMRVRMREYKKLKREFEP